MTQVQAGPELAQCAGKQMHEGETCVVKQGGDTVANSVDEMARKEASARHAIGWAAVVGGVVVVLLLPLAVAVPVEMRRT